MGQAYSDPKRAGDPHALPDVEIFYFDGVDKEFDSAAGPGWYWWSCFPGCMPDSDPFGPFETEQEALEDAQSNAGWDEDEQEGD